MNEHIGHQLMAELRTRAAVRDGEEEATLRRYLIVKAAASILARPASVVLAPAPTSSARGQVRRTRTAYLDDTTVRAKLRAVVNPAPERPSASGGR